MVSTVEKTRLDISRTTAANKKSQFGQFLTPQCTAAFMAELFPEADGTCRLLDPGAGIGSLSAAFLERWRAGRFQFRNLELDAYERIVFPHDPERFIHVPTSPRTDPIELSSQVRFLLADLGLSVSTGPVVDFRLRELLRELPAADTVPLLYPGHFVGGRLIWPALGSRKPNATRRQADTEKWLYPNGFYCVVRRFSAKEERRRIVASVVDPELLGDSPALGFENHLNQFCDAGIALYNPDQPGRAVNSPKAAYRIEPAALALVRTYGTRKWRKTLDHQLAGRETLVARYARERQQNWLLLIESVTSHGPVDGKRHGELARLFAGASAGLVCVTAFPNRAVMGRYLAEIAWETEVWVADAPSHLIQFNGVGFLGPYGSV